MSRHKALNYPDRLLRFVEDPWRAGSCEDLNFGMIWHYTDQGSAHWDSIYYYLNSHFGDGGKSSLSEGIKSPYRSEDMRCPTDEDFNYIIKEILPKGLSHPKDPFLLDKKNREYVEK